MDWTFKERRRAPISLQSKWRHEHCKALGVVITRVFWIRTSHSASCLLWEINHSVTLSPWLLTHVIKPHEFEWVTPSSTSQHLNTMGNTNKPPPACVCVLNRQADTDCIKTCNTLLAYSWYELLSSQISSLCWRGTTSYHRAWSNIPAYGQ